jgi:hypothetical protein
VTSEWAVRQTLHGYIRVIRKVSIRFRKQLISCSLGWLGCYGQPPQLRRRVTSTTPPSFGKTSKAKLLAVHILHGSSWSPCLSTHPLCELCGPTPLPFQPALPALFDSSPPRGQHFAALHTLSLKPPICNSHCLCSLLCSTTSSPQPTLQLYRAFTACSTLPLQCTSGFCHRLTLVWHYRALVLNLITVRSDENAPVSIPDEKLSSGQKRAVVVKRKLDSETAAALDRRRTLMVSRNSPPPHTPTGHLLRSFLLYSRLLLPLSLFHYFAALR